MNTGSSVLTSEDLGMSFSQYFGLSRGLKLSQETFDFITREHKWTIKCISCGRSFSPKLNARKDESKRCINCRLLWRREYHRFHKRRTLKIGPESYRKEFKLFKPTGSYIA